MMGRQKNLIGVAWPYVNGELHPGHIAGCYLPADIFARYKRLRGEDVIMVSGNDCFGTPITIQADKEGVTPRDIVEKYGPRTTSLLLDTYKISFDLFTKTDTDIHRQVTQKFFINLLKNGNIIKKKTYQYYSEIDNRFLPDRYVEGECPYCHAKEQRGDQCEVCGRSLQVGELINPYAKLTKNPVSLKETEHYFVDLPKFKSFLENYIQDKKQVWREWVWKEAYSWLEDLQPRSITRDLDWGVEIPQENITDESRLDNVDNKRFYVWFDAVIGYFSGSIAFAESIGENYEDFIKEWWNNDNPLLKHYIFVGKDNLFFHTIWWQSLLIGQNENLKLPDNVPVNQFLNLEGQKFSKSRGIYINAKEVVEKYGLDAVRFYLTSIMPENNDANWKWDDFIASYNNDLVSNIGNFIHRTITFAQNKLQIKYLNQIKPENRIFDEYSLEIATDNKKIENVINIKRLLLGDSENKNIFELFTENLENMNFKQALQLVLLLSKIGNVYFDRKAPWQLQSQNPDECEKTIYNSLLLVYVLRILLNPFLPDASDRISNALGLQKLESTKTQAKNHFLLDLNEFHSIKLSANTQPLFNKIQHLV